MSKSAKRPLVALEGKWRLPEDDVAINHYPFFLASGIAALVANLVGLMLSFILIMAVWLFAAHGNESTIQVVRASAIAWQATHLIPLTIGTIPVSLLPWGFLLIPVIAIWRTMQWAIKSVRPASASSFWSIAICYSLLYGAISTLLSLLCSTEGLSTNYGQAFIHSSAIALFVSSAAILTFAPTPNVLLEKLPRDFVTGLKPGLIVFLIFWLLSCIVTVFILAFRWNELKTVSSLMAPSSIDRTFLTLLCIAYLPTIITWVFSYLLGASVYLGGSAIVNTTIVQPGALPAFPLLSILPSEVIPWAKYLIALPIIVGALIYFLIPRKSWSAKGDSLPVALSHTIRLNEFVRIVGALIVVAGSSLIITYLSSGALGTSFLSHLGPRPTEVGLQTLKIFGVAALATLLVPRLILSLIHWWANRPKPQKVDP